jgi:hypothetical protein
LASRGDLGEISIIRVESASEPPLEDRMLATFEIRDIERYRKGRRILGWFLSMRILDGLLIDGSRLPRFEIAITIASASFRKIKSRDK